MTTDTRPVRIRWKGSATDGPLHATIDGQIAGTLNRAYLDQWTLDDATIARYPVLFGIGPRALSTWRAKLGATVRAFGIEG